MILVYDTIIQIFYTRIFSLRSNSRIKRILTDLFLLYISFLGHDARISPSSTCKTHPKIFSKSIAHRFKQFLKHNNSINMVKKYLLKQHIFFLHRMKFINFAVLNKNL